LEAFLDEGRHLRSLISNGRSVAGEQEATLVGGRWFGHSGSSLGLASDVIGGEKRQERVKVHDLAFIEFGFRVQGSCEGYGPRVLLVGCNDFEGETGYEG